MSSGDNLKCCNCLQIPAGTKACACRRCSCKQLHMYDVLGGAEAAHDLSGWPYLLQGSFKSVADCALLGAGHL